MDYVMSAIDGANADHYVPGTFKCANETLYFQRDVSYIEVRVYRPSERSMNGTRTQGVHSVKKRRWPSTRQQLSVGTFQMPYTFAGSCLRQLILGGRLTFKHSKACMTSRQASSRTSWETTFRSLTSTIKLLQLLRRETSRQSSFKWLVWQEGSLISIACRTPLCLKRPKDLVLTWTTSQD